MLTRRNWLLRCSIFINVVVLLYVCSHVMIGSETNFIINPAAFVQDEYQRSRQNLLMKEKLESKSREQQDNNNIENAERVQAALQRDKDFEDDNEVANVEKFRQQPQQQQQKQQVDQNPDNRPRVVTDISAPLTEATADEKRFDVVNASNYTMRRMSEINMVVGQQDAVSFVNTTNSDGYVVNNEDRELDERLRSILKCHDRDYRYETVQRGDFWVLKNYVRADHDQIKCHESITYTTHADYTFLDNLIPLIDRWNAPISIALHAPGTDFNATINSIKYLRDCLPESPMVRQFVTFHIYFSTKHIPKTVPKSDELLETPFNCSLSAPFLNVTSAQLFKTQKKLLYPVNVGRNIARDAALTHFILASDIELYPNPGLVKKFLEMVSKNDANYQRKNPKVFTLPIFEVENSVPVPKDKTELQELLKVNKAVQFHKRVCPICHGVPKLKEWIAANESEELGVFHIGKRVGYFSHWEPIYIGTLADPHYDERLSWEGKSDKMTQGYALCALDYEFHILDNAFLVHKPGIKVLKKDTKRAMLASKTNQLIKKIIYPELKVMYGTRKGCGI